MNSDLDIPNVPEIPGTRPRQRFPTFIVGDVLDTILHFSESAH